LFFFNGDKLLERTDVNNLRDPNYVECSTGLAVVTDLKIRYQLG
jgi:hypothetical protein